MAIGGGNEAGSLPGDEGGLSDALLAQKDELELAQGVAEVARGRHLARVVADE